jgi:ABC-type sugar transport system ATPase subunit
MPWSAERPGKSTLIRSSPGCTSRPGSTIEIPGDQRGRPRWNPAKAFAAGMRFVHQNPGVFQS